MLSRTRSLALLTLTALLSLTQLCLAAPSEITFHPAPSRRDANPRKITVRHYTLNLTTDTIWQNNEPFGPTVLVNSSFPGPVIRARAGEVLQVRVWNHLNTSGEQTDGNATMHFHGLSMKMHPVMDGTMMVSQWPIQPGHYFDYRIPLTAEDKGTYFYHSHVGVQAMTAYGAVVVEDPETWDFSDPSDATMQVDDDGECAVEYIDVYGTDGLNENGKSGYKSPYYYDEDRVLAMGDWFGYSSTKQVETQLNGDPFVWPGSATKLTYNGMTSPNAINVSAPACNQTLATPLDISCSSAPAPSSDYPTIELDYDKTYRLRFVGATALMYVSMAILKPTATPYNNSTMEGSVAVEKLMLIEADGSYLDPLSVENIELTTGQRYSVLYTAKCQQEVEADGTGGVYWMRVESRWRSGPSMWVKIVYPNANTMATPPMAGNNSTLELLPKETFGWVASSLSPLSKSGGPSWWYSSEMPKDCEVTRTVVIDTQQVKFYSNGKGVKWDENGLPYNESFPGNGTPYLVRTFLGDIPFPTAEQFQSAMDNPTTYNTDHGMVGIIGNSTQELEAAKGRHWANGYDSDLNMYFANEGEVIDIVLVNRPSELSAAVEIHPWHMHSHKHWSRTIQPGTFNFTRLAALYEYQDDSPSSPPPSPNVPGYVSPTKRDTTIAYASPGAAYLNQNLTDPAVEDGGFAVLRYKVEKENAGVFLLHCHIQFHLYMGMATVWTIGASELANQTGMYWPTDVNATSMDGVKNAEKTKGQDNIEGLSWNYLKFNESVPAVTQ